MITMDKGVFLCTGRSSFRRSERRTGKGRYRDLPVLCVYEDVKGLKASDKVLLEDICTNYTLYKAIPEQTEVVFEANPAAIMKGNKNQTEMENIRIAHIKDAKAMCRFIYWLKQNVGSGEVTEYSAAEKSLEFRKEDPDCLDLKL